MAKRKYAKSAGKDVEKAMDRMKKGKLKRGKKGHGGTVKDPKQAIAIGLSEARKEGKKVPAKATKKTSKKKATRKKSSKKTSKKASKKTTKKSSK